MDGIIIIVVVLLLLLVVSIISYLIAYYASCSQKIIVVEEVLIEHTNNAKCFISDADETYRVKNPRLLGLAALDEYAAIEHTLVRVDKSYEITTYGWRIPFLGWHKNVVSIIEAPV